ncbi:MAG TPA: PEP-CTERM sorting domain-containing protein [Falsiroseomonas sp.]|jgi:hypothetical protein|nr:PEP-CTERM sorting domain-containing protein [Falsiroseomonas sp.]
MFKQALLGAALAAGLAAAPASAAVMDFTGLVDFSAAFDQNGINGTSGSWWNWPGADMAHFDDGTATFTYAGGLFNLISVDMISGGGNGPARFTAFLNNVQVATVDVGGGAGTFAFGATFGGIDQVVVSYVSDHFTIDNLTIAAATAVPEPMSLALLGTGLLGLAVSRRRRAARQA